MIRINLAVTEILIYQRVLRVMLRDCYLTCDHRITRIRIAGRATWPEERHMNRPPHSFKRSTYDTAK